MPLGKALSQGIWGQKALGDHLCATSPLTAVEEEMDRNLRSCLRSSSGRSSGLAWVSNWGQEWAVGGREYWGPARLSSKNTGDNCQNDSYQNSAHSLVNCLSQNTRTQAQIPSTHTKARLGGVTCNLSAGEVETRGSWASASQPGQPNQWVVGSVRELSQRIKWRGIEKYSWCQPLVSTSMHVSVCAFPHMCAHVWPSTNMYTTYITKLVASATLEY